MSEPETQLLIRILQRVRHPERPEFRDERFEDVDRASEDELRDLDELLGVVRRVDARERQRIQAVAQRVFTYDQMMRYIRRMLSQPFTAPYSLMAVVLLFMYYVMIRLVESGVRTISSFMGWVSNCISSLVRGGWWFWPPLAQ